MPVDEVNAWCVFVQCWAGCVVPVTLIELERFSKILRGDCKFPATMWLCLSKLNITAYPEYVVALVKAMLSAPQHMIVRGESKIFLTADFNNMSKKIEDIKSATLIMRQARAFVLQEYTNLVAHTSAGGLEKLVGDLDVRLVCYNHGKNIKGRVQLKALVDAGKHFAADLQKCLGSAYVPANCPWTASLREPPAEKCKNAMRSFSEQGVDLSVLANEGYKVGVTVKSENTSKMWTLHEIVADSNSVVLSSATDSKEKTTVSVASLLDSYTIVANVEKIVTGPLSECSNPLGGREAMLEYYKAQFVCALRKLYMQHNHTKFGLVCAKQAVQSAVCIQGVQSWVSRIGTILDEHLCQYHQTNKLMCCCFVFFLNCWATCGQTLNIRLLICHNSLANRSQQQSILACNWLRGAKVKNLRISSLCPSGQ